MKRRTSQLLYNYTPESVFRHAKFNYSGIVKKVYEDFDSDSLPKRHLLNRLNRRIYKWSNGESARFDNADVVFPDGVEYEIYPLTFQCHDCQSVAKLRPGDIRKCDWDSGSGLDNCSRCGAQLRDSDQLDILSACNCGNIQELNIPECCSAGMALKIPGRNLDSGYWYCPDCEDSKDFYSIPSQCFNCEDGTLINGSMNAKPVSSSSLMYPQIAHLINVQRSRDYMSAEKHQEEVIRDYLSQDVSSTETDMASVEVTAAREYVEEGVYEKAEILLEGTDISVDDLKTQVEEDDVDEFIEEISSEQELQSIAEELFEHLSVTADIHKYHPENKDISSVSLEDWSHKPDTTHLTSDRVDKYKEHRNDLGLENVKLVENFPITTVAYGYTRNHPEPQSETENKPVRFRKFQPRFSDTPQIYAQTYDAEALMLSLDKSRVVNWLIENDILEEAPSNLDKWFIQNLRTPGRFESVDSDDRVVQLCFTLLHTLAHITSRVIGALSGYSKDSLVEHMFPRTMSFVVYKRPDTDYSLGSLFTLVEERFDEFADEVNEASFCSLDPTCKHEEGGACEECLYTSPLTCANSNHNLSRSTLFGGEFNELNLQGFLNV